MLVEDIKVEISWLVPYEWAAAPLSSIKNDAAFAQFITDQKEKKIIAQVHGIGYPQREVYENLAAHFRRCGEAPFHIGLLHCNVGTDTGHEAYALSLIHI